MKTIKTTFVHYLRLFEHRVGLAHGPSTAIEGPLWRSQIAFQLSMSC